MGAAEDPHHCSTWLKLPFGPDQHELNHMKICLKCPLNSGSLWTASHLGLDDKRPVSSYGDLLLHDTEVVEPADQQTSAVQPQAEVHVMTGEPVLVVLDVLTAVHVKKQEVVKVTSGEGNPLFVLC